MERIYDMIVIGGGPAGLSAGIYGGRAKLDVLIIEKENKGGQISLTSEVVNYPGILEISGSEFMTQTKKQAQNFGVNFVQEEVIDRFENPVEIVVFKDPNNEESVSIENAVKDIASISPEKLKFSSYNEGENKGLEAKVGETFGVFVFVGYAPSSQIFKGHIEIGEGGFIPTNEDLMTNVKGVFAVGDIRPKRLRQVVTAVADGAIAATSIEKYVHDLREELGLKKEEKEEEKTTSIKTEKETFLDDDLRKQLVTVVDRFENPVEIVVFKNPAIEESLAIEDAVKDIASIAPEKLRFSSYNEGENKELEAKVKVERTPTIAVLDKDGNFSGLKYSSLPSGHELNSFILGLYNVAGPGQKVAPESLEKIEKIDKPINIKIGISLSCTKCPKTVQATQRIATLNKNIEMEMINIFTFQDFKNRYDIMSVPAIIVDDQHVYFGEKTVEDMLEIINK